MAVSLFPQYQGIDEQDAVFGYNGGRYYAITLNDDGRMYYNELMSQKTKYKN